jgi:GTP-binding protein HflX
VLVSALTGYGLDALRAELAALLGSLWVEVDATVPYAAGSLLARIRERGTVDLVYGDRGVRVRGRISPQLEAEIRAAADGSGTKSSPAGAS